jgi:hypothetical protein
VIEVACRKTAREGTIVLQDLSFDLRLESEDKSRFTHSLN